MTPHPDASAQESSTLDAALRQLRDRAIAPGPDEATVATTKAALDAEMSGSVWKTSHDVSRPTRRRTLRYGSASAAAAVVLVGVFLALSSRPSSAAALLQRSLEKLGGFTTLQMRMIRTADGAQGEEGMLYFHGNTWAHYARNHGRRGDPDPKQVPFLAAVINDLDRRKSLGTNFAEQTWSWLEIETERPITSRLANFANVSGDVVRHRGQEEVGGVLADVIEVRVDELLGRMHEAKVTVWIDRRTELPVQIRSDETFQGPRGPIVESTVYTDIEWNPEFDERLLSLTPPEGYRQVAPVYTVPVPDPSDPPPPERAPADER